MEGPNELGLGPIMPMSRTTSELIGTVSASELLSIIKPQSSHSESIEALRQFTTLTIAHYSSQLTQVKDQPSLPSASL